MPGACVPIPTGVGSAKHRRRAALIATITVVSGLLGAFPAKAAVVAPALPYDNWHPVGGAPAAEVRAPYMIVIDPVAQAWQRQPNVFWATQFQPANSPSGGYFGFQDKTYGAPKVAIFSWWNALDASCAGVPNVVACQPFSGEGSGYQTLVSFDWKAGTPYTFRLWRGAQDTARGAHWWTVEVLNGVGTKLATVGSILVPSAWGGIGHVAHWTEWFAAGAEAADHCDQIPQTETVFGAPLFDGVAGSPYNVGVSPSGVCPSEAEWVDGGSRQRFGTATPATTTIPKPTTVENPRAGWVLPAVTSLDGVGTWVVAANSPIAGAGEVAPSYLYAMTFTFTGSTTATGFIGLVTSPAGKFAMFTAKEPGGTTHAAMTLLDWKPGHLYYPFLYRVGPGQWGAWVYDYSAGAWVSIGLISLPGSWGSLSPSGSTTAVWAGPTAPTCSAYPAADVYFHRPTAYLNGTALPTNSGLLTPTGGGCASTTTFEGDWTRFRLGRR